MQEISLLILSTNCSNDTLVGTHIEDEVVAFTDILIKASFWEDEQVNVVDQSMKDGLVPSLPPNWNLQLYSKNPHSV